METSAILLTVVYIYMGFKLDSFLRKKVFLVLFCSRGTLYIVRDSAKKIYISKFILQGHNNILKNILRVRCNLRKIKFSGLKVAATL